jgi:hypothetical protein
MVDPIEALSQSKCFQFMCKVLHVGQPTDAANGFPAYERGKGDLVLGPNVALCIFELLLHRQQDFANTVYPIEPLCQSERFQLLREVLYVG